MIAILRIRSFSSWEMFRRFWHSDFIRILPLATRFLIGGWAARLSSLVVVIFSEI